MTALRPQRRSKTAKELAEQFGVSTRTVQRLMAEPRQDYLDRAKRNRIRAGRLRAQGLKYDEIAAEMGMSRGAVARLVRDARLKGEVLELAQQ